MNSGNALGISLGIALGIALGNTSGITFRKSWATHCFCHGFQYSLGLNNDSCFCENVSLDQNDSYPSYLFMIINCTENRSKYLVVFKISCHHSNINVATYDIIM